MKFALALEYNGGGFCGWQSQAGGGSVQDAAEDALAQVAGRRIRLHAAGRTDAGVHAALMPAHFESDAPRQPSAWLQGANAHLPPSVKMLWVKPVRADFHARYQAQRRYYQYLLLNRAAAPGLLQGQVGHCHVPLDIAAMRLAARRLRGRHDFSAFRAASCQAKTPVRTLHQLRINRRGDVVVFEFCGDGFLHHMVRNIVGSLLYVGRQRREPQWMRELLNGKDRGKAAPTAAASGLYFNGALYPPHYRLPPCVQPAPLLKA